MVVEPVQVVGGADDRGVEIEAVNGETGDRHFTFNTAERSEHVYQAYTAVSDRDFVGGEPVKQRRCINSCDLELGESREIGDTNLLASSPNFLGNSVEGIGAPERVPFGFTEVLRTLPAVNLLPLGTQRVEAAIDRVDFLTPRRRPVALRGGEPDTSRGIRRSLFRW